MSNYNGLKYFLLYISLILNLYMDNNTLLILKNLNFNQIMLKLLTPNQSGKAFPEQITYKTMLLIALTTGVPLTSIIRLEWGDVIKIDSKGKFQCLDRFKIKRNYDFPISLRIRNQLLEFYHQLNQPKLDSSLSDSFQKTQGINEWLLGTSITLGTRKIPKSKGFDWSTYKNKHLTQILFGRRILETCGYSNSNSKLLKGLFKVKTNEQLFNFLYYDSKTSINFSLSEISITEGLNSKYSFGEPKSFLDDNKHFLYKKKNSKEFYPFQHFQVFYDFLNNLNFKKYDIKTQSVLLLLMISLTNGIRPSKLLRLNWSDIFNPEKDGIYNSIIIRRTFLYEKYQLKIDENITEKILTVFILLSGQYGRSTKRDGDEITFFRIKPKISNNCFVTSRLNPITQNSLHREIQNTLQVTGFQHADKFTTKSTQIMYGRRVIELKGLHPPTIRALKKHFNIRKTQDLFDFLFISNPKGKNIPDIGEFGTVFEHILYDI